MKYEDDLKRAADQQRANKEWLTAMRKTKPRNLDDRFQQAHQEVFEQINCLECANCCKTTSPIFQTTDIERLARVFRMKVPAFIDTYLHLDADGDYVLNEAPCPFLAADNTCIVYEDRPKACREYPHTDRKRMYQIMDLTFRNSLMCPAVSRIVEQLRTANG